MHFVLEHIPQHEILDKMDLMQKKQECKKLKSIFIFE